MEKPDPLFVVPEQGDKRKNYVRVLAYCALKANFNLKTEDLNTKFKEHKAALEELSEESCTTDTILKYKELTRQLVSFLNSHITSESTWYKSFIKVLEVFNQRNSETSQASQGKDDKTRHHPKQQNLTARARKGNEDLRPASKQSREDPEDSEDIEEEFSSEGNTDKDEEEKANIDKFISHCRVGAEKLYFQRVNDPKAWADEVIPAIQGHIVEVKAAYWDQKNSLQTARLLFSSNLLPDKAPFDVNAKYTVGCIEALSGKLAVLRALDHYMEIMQGPGKPSAASSTRKSQAMLSKESEEPKPSHAQKQSTVKDSNKEGGYVSESTGKSYVQPELPHNAYLQNVQVPDFSYEEGKWRLKQITDTLQDTLRKHFGIEPKASIATTMEARDASISKKSSLPKKFKDLDAEIKNNPPKGSKKLALGQNWLMGKKFGANRKDHVFAWPLVGGKGEYNIGDLVVMPARFNNEWYYATYELIHPSIENYRVEIDEETLEVKVNQEYQHVSKDEIDAVKVRMSSSKRKPSADDSEESDEEYEAQSGKEVATEVPAKEQFKGTKAQHKVQGTKQFKRKKAQARLKDTLQLSLEEDSQADVENYDNENSKKGRANAAAAKPPAAAAAKAAAAACGPAAPRPARPPAAAAARAAEARAAAAARAAEARAAAANEESRAKQKWEEAVAAAKTADAKKRPGHEDLPQAGQPSKSPAHKKSKTQSPSKQTKVPGSPKLPSRPARVPAAAAADEGGAGGPAGEAKAAEEAEQWRAFQEFQKWQRMQQQASKTPK